MSKKDKIIETIEVEDASLLPELLDGKHHVIPIVTGGDEVAEEVEVPEINPILTLRSSVLLPGANTPITLGRAEGGILGAVLQRESEVEDPSPDDMYKVGTAARIIKILEMPNGNLTVILNGLEKIEIREYITTEPYFRARVTALRDTTPDLKSIEFEALVDSIRDVALGIINVSPTMPKEAAFAIKNIDSKRGIINFICSNMELTDEDRQSLLEAPGLLARARKLLEILVREQQLAELKHQTGLDRPVQDFVFSFDQTHEFMRQLEKMISCLLPLYSEEGKSVLVIAIGCTGGHHRSVAVAHALADLVRRAGFPVSESHRDLGRN